MVQFLHLLPQNESPSSLSNVNSLSLTCPQLHMLLLSGFTVSCLKTGVLSAENFPIMLISFYKKASQKLQYEVIDNFF